MIFAQKTYFIKKSQNFRKISKFQNACTISKKYHFFTKTHFLELPLDILIANHHYTPFWIDSCIFKFFENSQNFTIFRKTSRNPFVRISLISIFPKYEQSFSFIKFQKNIRTPCFAPPFDADFHSESKFEIKNGGHRAQKKVPEMPVWRHHFFGNSRNFLNFPDFGHLPRPNLVINKKIQKSKI